MFRFTRNRRQALSKNTKIHYVKLLKLFLGSQTFYVMGLCIFREGLMMIPSESKHVAQGQ